MFFSFLVFIIAAGRKRNWGRSHTLCDTKQVKFSQAIIVQLESNLASPNAAEILQTSKEG